MAHIKVLAEPCAGQGHYSEQLFTHNVVYREVFLLDCFAVPTQQSMLPVLDKTPLADIAAGKAKYKAQRLRVLSMREGRLRQQTST